ncbi:hypothetical protein DPMN_115884 [Dreissena polymorpha]|uniref:Uncharacterized protein n=1 Tax=Dreissena polymorpha TaxID=45954 RepID=A0A9D4KMR4_DREPO|nr:hypothetical protein DPMN_115884 [Dreissena polymorpha]
MRTIDKRHQDRMYATEIKICAKFEGESKRGNNAQRTETLKYRQLQVFRIDLVHDMSQRQRHQSETSHSLEPNEYDSIWKNMNINKKTKIPTALYGCES